MELSLSQKLTKIEDMVGGLARKGYPRTCVVGGREEADLCEDHNVNRYRIRRVGEVVLEQGLQEEEICLPLASFDVLKRTRIYQLEAHYRNISRNLSISGSGRDLDGTTDVSSVNGSRRGSMFSKRLTADQPLQTDKSRRESIRTAFFDVTPNQGSGENTPSGYDPFNRSRRQSIQPMLGNQHQLNENASSLCV